MVAPGATLASSATHNESLQRRSDSGGERCALALRSLHEGSFFGKREIGGSIVGRVLQGFDDPQRIQAAGMDMVSPLAVRVQVSLLAPKSLGTVTVKTPHARRGVKVGGLAAIGRAGLKLIQGPMGTSTCSV